MSKIIAASKTLEFKILPKEITALDNEVFFPAGHQVRYVLNANYVKGLADMDELNKPKIIDRKFQLEMLSGSIKLLKNQWDLINRYYKVKVNNEEWRSGKFNGKVNSDEFYMIECRGGGICTLKISIIGSVGFGRDTHVIDLRSYVEYQYKELVIQIRSRDAQNTLLESLIKMECFLQDNVCDQFEFHPK